jgi:recombination DNA repair RAD52 pathway protein
VAAQLQKDADAEKLKEQQKKTAALEHLRNAGMTVLADNLQNNIITADKAMELANVDPRITTLANEHLQKSIDLGSQSSSAVDLLLSYNDLDISSGKPAEVKRQVEAAFGIGDKNRLLTFAYAEGRIKESNILMPAGSVTEMEVKRSDATQPEITESPEVVRGYLYGKAKKNALGAAQENALQKWMINWGNTSGFVDYWRSVINDPAQLQAIFDKAGIPPNQNFKRRVISGAQI